MSLRLLQINLHHSKAASAALLLRRELKFLYSHYICDIERKLITNPKSFWHFVDSKRTTPYFP